MKRVTLTELNEQTSAITREVIERGEPIVVTMRGRPVLHLVPEAAATDDPVSALVAVGKASPPRVKSTDTVRRAPAVLSRSLDGILAEERADAESWPGQYPPQGYVGEFFRVVLGQSDASAD